MTIVVVAPAGIGLSDTFTFCPEPLLTGQPLAHVHRHLARQRRQEIV